MNVNTNYNWLSIGENCLPDDILKRHNLKSFSTPYSSGRSNIDYILEIENSNYYELINPINLTYADAWGSKVVRSKSIIKSDDIFDLSCSQGFEFTHHNPIDSLKDRESIVRKIERMKYVKKNKNIVFLYHHRRTKKSNIELIRFKLKQFSLLYTSENVKCYVVFFYQSAVLEKSKRRLEKINKSDAIIEFEFHTEFVWGGKDNDIFWARNDDDLILEMICNTDKYISS